MSRKTSDELAYLKAIEESEPVYLGKLFNTKKLAEYLDITEHTLRQYRLAGTGPEYIKIGHLVRYRDSDIEKWLKSRQV